MWFSTNGPIVASGSADTDYWAVRGSESEKGNAIWWTKHGVAVTSKTRHGSATEKAWLRCLDAFATLLKPLWQN